jgi:hypothetical protein
MLFFATNCTEDGYGDSNKKTYSGYVAFDYTIATIRDYAEIIKNIHNFSIYHSQPTFEKRDSVDRLYFREIKILKENDSIWTLTQLSDSHLNIQINTHNNSILNKEAAWTVINNDSYEPSFKITNNNGIWRIENSEYNNSVFFIRSEWDISPGSLLIDDKYIPVLELNSAGELLSHASPRLKLEYRTTEPIIYYLNDDSSFKSGSIKISATDVNKDITEETNAEITSNNTVNIIFKNNKEQWDFYSKK